MQAMGPGSEGCAAEHQQLVQKVASHHVADGQIGPPPDRRHQGGDQFWHRGAGRHNRESNHGLAHPEEASGGAGSLHQHVGAETQQHNACGQAQQRPPEPLIGRARIDLRLGFLHAIRLFPSRADLPNRVDC